MRCAACEEETEQAPCGRCGAEPRLDGRYALVRVIGRGAHGITWEALDPDGQRVALKEMVLARDAAEKTNQLAQREAAVLRQLEHPQIPSFVEAFTTGTGRMRSFCVVQEFVEGHTLAQELERHRYTEDEVLAIAEEIQEILKYLHGLSPPVVHRDLKPENVMRRPDGCLALIDFGSVRDSLKDADLGGSTVAGTFGYMAPEQFRGDAFPATDYYALGALMAALLTREDPARMLGQDRKLAWQRHCKPSPVMRQLIDGLLAQDPEGRGRVVLRELGFAEPVSEEVAALFEPRDHRPPVPYVASAHAHPPPTPGPQKEANRVFTVVAMLVMVVCFSLVVSVGLIFFAYASTANQPPLVAASPASRGIELPAQVVAPGVVVDAPIFVLNRDLMAHTVSIGDHSQRIPGLQMMPVHAQRPATLGIDMADGVATVSIDDPDAYVVVDDVGAHSAVMQTLGPGETDFRVRTLPVYPEDYLPRTASCMVDVWLEPSGSVAYASASGCPLRRSAEEAVERWRHAPREGPFRTRVELTFEPPG